MEPWRGQLSAPGQLVPYVEHFANTDDLVARIGVLSSRSAIPGRVFVRKRSGHLLNAHYLSGMRSERGAYAWLDDRKKKHRDSRLMAYRWGRG